MKIWDESDERKVSLTEPTGEVSTGVGQRFTVCVSAAAFVNPFEFVTPVCERQEMKKNQGSNGPLEHLTFHIPHLHTPFFFGLSHPLPPPISADVTVTPTFTLLWILQNNTTSYYKNCDFLQSFNHFLLNELMFSLILHPLLFVFVKIICGCCTHYQYIVLFLIMH